MPRNGSGSMSLTTTFVANTPALAADVNTVLGDIRDEITNSIAKDGQTTLTGALKGADGSATAPGYAFASDANTGLYRIAADTLGIAAGGAEIARVSSAGLVMAAGKTISAPGGFASGGVVPAGGIIMWSGSVASIPAGWYLCDGLNGTPDLRNRFIIGAGVDNAGVSNTTVTGANTKSGGTKDAVAVSHTHAATVTDPGHTHDITVDYSAVGGSGSTRQYWANPTVDPMFSATKANYAQSKTTGITVANSTAGVSGTDQNLPPYYALAFIMKA